MVAQCYFYPDIGGMKTVGERLPNEAQKAENRGRRPRAGAGFLEGAKVFSYFQHSGWSLLIL